MERSAAKFESFRGWAVLSDFYFWAWGLDLRKSNRELFLSYGFKRMRPPRGVSSKSMYVLTFQDGGFLCFWPFGFLYSHFGKPALFHKRGTLKPRRVKPFLSAPQSYIAYEHLEFMGGQTDCVLGLWSEVSFRLAAFENWIESRKGPEYRAQCFREWKDCGIDFDVIKSIKDGFLTHFSNIGLDSQASLSVVG